MTEPDAKQNVNCKFYSLSFTTHVLQNYNNVIVCFIAATGIEQCLTS